MQIKTACGQIASCAERVTSTKHTENVRFAVEADCKRKNGHGRRRARQYGRITKPRQAAGLLGFVAEGYTVSV